MRFKLGLEKQGGKKMKKENKINFELVIASGRSINTTGNHLYLKGWIKVAELKENDYIAVPIIKNNINKGNNQNEKVVERARSLTEKALLWLRRVSHEFESFQDTCVSHTLKGNRHNNYKNFLVSKSDVFFDRIVSIKVHEPQHVYDLTITHNSIANDILAYSAYNTSNVLDCNNCITDVLYVQSFVENQEVKQKWKKSWKKEVLL